MNRSGYSAAIGHDIETEDTTVAAVRFVNGALGLIYGTTASYPGSLRRVEITGTQGTVVFLENNFSVWQFARETAEDDRIREKFAQAKNSGGASAPSSGGYENHMHNIKAFIDALESREEFCLGGTESRKAVEVVLAIYESAKKQKPVKLG